MWVASSLCLYAHGYWIHLRSGAGHKYGVCAWVCIATNTLHEGMIRFKMIVLNLIWQLFCQRRTDREHINKPFCNLTNYGVLAYLPRSRAKYLLPSLVADIWFWFEGPGSFSGVQGCNLTLLTAELLVCVHVTFLSTLWSTEFALERAHLQL